MVQVRRVPALLGFHGGHAPCNTVPANTELVPPRIVGGVSGSRLLRHALAVGVMATATVVACGAPQAGTSPSSSTTYQVTVDVQQMLAANGESFEPLDVQTNVGITESQAIAAALAQVSGTPTRTSAVFGRLKVPGRLGVRSDRLAWLVTIEGAAPPRLNTAGPAPVGPLRTAAFIDAEDGRNLIMIATGAGP